MQKELKDLREANLKLIEKQEMIKENAAEKVAKEEALAEEEISVEVLDTEPVIEDVESKGGASSSAIAEAKAGQTERADPVAAAPSIEEIIETLKPAIEESGGGTIETNKLKSK